MARPERLHSVQYLRALAALMVVVHHAKAPQYFLDRVYLAGYPAFAWGVDIFFVVSGFIMATTAVNDPPRLFYAKRLVRIVPLYWVATLALLTLIVVRESSTGATARDIVLSLLFVPHYNELSGQLLPYLVPGWTLNFEMFFYLIFGIGLALRRPVAVTLGTIAPLVVIGVLVQPHNALAATYTSPLMLEFLGGVVLAVAYRRGYLRQWHALLALAGAAALFSSPFGPAWLGVPTKVVASTLIVMGVVAVNGRIPVIRLGTLLGDASYSIYLTHTIVSLMIGARIVGWLPLSGAVEFAAWIALAVTVSSGVGVLSYWFVERPLLAKLRPRPSIPTPPKAAVPETT